MSRTSTWSADDHPPVTDRVTRRRSLSTDTPVLTLPAAGRPDAWEHAQREDLLAAGGEVARALLAGRRRHDVQQLIATRTWQATNAALVAVGTSTDGDALNVGASAGPDSARLRPRSVRLRPTAPEGPTWSLEGTQIPTDRRPESGLALALGTTGAGASRVLVVLGLPTAGRAAATRALQGFAQHAAEAITLAEERLASEHEQLLQDRDRTATGLSELVIPLLFDAGVRLAGADGLLHDRSTQARARIRQAADDLDLAVVQIRTVALGIRNPARPPPGDRHGTTPWRSA